MGFGLSPAVLVSLVFLKTRFVVLWLTLVVWVNARILPLGSLVTLRPLLAVVGDGKRARNVLLLEMGCNVRVTVRIGVTAMGERNWA